jgi:hypothetical protein
MACWIISMMRLASNNCLSPPTNPSAAGGNFTIIKFVDWPM